MSAKRSNTTYDTRNDAWKAIDGIRSDTFSPAIAGKRYQNESVRNRRKLLYCNTLPA